MVGDGNGMTNAEIVALIKRNPRYAKHLQLLRGGTPFTSKANLPDIRRCIFLGDRIPGQPCGSPLSVCKLHNDVTSQLYPCTAAKRCCEGCTDKRLRQPFTPRPDDARVGVAIGSFRWPELVDLQCRVIRDTCGPVPILVSNDDPDGHKALAAICAKHPGVTLDTNPERIGHTGGDIAVFSKAIRWGAERGLEAVAKLSQRFVIDRTRWLQDSAAELLLSGLPMASRRCRGDAPFDLRTEAVLMDIGQWNRPEVLERIKPRRYWDDSPTGLPAETIIFRVLQDLLGGVFWPWASLMGEDRCRRDAKDILWHTNTFDREYRSLATRYGVTLPAEFHVGGWEKEQEEGQYIYG
jgi:hypothetical protein